MRKTCFLYVVLFLMLTLGLLASPQNALADIAPPYNPPGANLAPGSETTQVRMVAETVLIDVLRNTKEGSLGQARVTADFTMRNLGSAEEALAVRFPISASDGRFNMVEIRDLQVQVNNRSTPTRRTNGEDPNSPGETAPWAEFDVKFPPGEEIHIRVSYLLEGTGYPPFTAFYYLLSTGAGWNSTIGSAELTVRLPYEANAMNVIFDEQIGWSQTTSGGTIEGREVRWGYTELEPSREHNLEISLVMPSVWQKILNEVGNITRNPDDGEAWGRLGKGYKEITFFSKWMRSDPGGAELYRLSREAYEKCLSLLPNDALWHAGYADLLYIHYWMTEGREPDGGDASDLLLALSELNRALEINPKTGRALEIAEDISWSYPEYVSFEDGRANFLALTATPTRPAAATLTPSAATQVPSATPEPTQTLTPPPPTVTAAPSLQASYTVTESPAASVDPTMAAPTEPTTPSEDPGIQVCGIGLAPLALILTPALARRWRVKKHRNG